MYSVMAFVSVARQLSRSLQNACLVLEWMTHGFMTVRVSALPDLLGEKHQSSFQRTNEFYRQPGMALGDPISYLKLRNPLRRGAPCSSP